MPLNPYGRRWKEHRARFLQAHPLCRMCKARGIVEPATVLDHIKPWKSGETEAEQERLFWDQSNWQGLCRTDHDAVKQALEKSGFLRGSTLQGLPLDPRHHWWKA